VISCPACGGADTTFFARARDVEYHTSDEAFEYRRCRGCEAVFLPSPPTDRLAEIYPPSYYSLRSGGRMTFALRMKQRLDARLFRTILSEIPGERLTVLDAGGGTGWILTVIREADRRVRETHEVDLDESARSEAEAAGHFFHRGRIEDFDSDQRFDLIVLLNLIEHVADPGAVLRSMAGLLSDDGRLLIKTPNTDTLDLRLFRHRNWGGFHAPRHWVLFNRRNLLALAEQSGLACVWTRYTQGAPQWTNSLLAWLAGRGLVEVSAARPMHTHPLHAPLLAATAAFDFLRRPFMPTAQMFVLLKRAPALRSGA
jgi:SAM-dependent methyltransferase